MGRAYIIAKMLQNDYLVEILGPVIEDPNEPIWTPISNDKSISYVRLEGNLNSLFKDLKKIDGDLVYAIKPKITSYGYGLLKKVINRKKLILDEDDWDIALFFDKSFFTLFKNSLNFRSLWNPLYNLIINRLYFCADAMTVSSLFLQRKFKGVIIPHARDPKAFKINTRDVEELRLNLKLKGKKMIVFMGTVRQHKGIDNIVRAIDMLQLPDVRLVVVGVDDRAQKFIPNRNYIILIPPQPFNRIAQYVSLADLVVLPQKATKFAEGQIPAKLIDAMALGKPIITTNIGSIPETIGNGGILVEPDNIIELSEKISELLQDNKKSKDLGKKARRIFTSLYSMDKVKVDLLNVVHPLIREAKT